MQMRPFHAKLFCDLMPSPMWCYEYDLEFCHSELIDAQSCIIEEHMSRLYESGRIDSRTLVAWLSAAMEEPALYSSVDLFVALNWYVCACLCANQNFDLTNTQTLTRRKSNGALRKWLLALSKLIVHRGGVSCILGAAPTTTPDRAEC
jgi:hypothetical protein